MDIIQEALQQSSINLDANSHVNIEDDLEMFEYVDLSVSDLTISDNSTTTPATCEDIQTDFPIIPYPEFVTEEEPLSASHLWTSVSTEKKQDVALGLVSCKGVEKFHDIQPTGNGRCRQHNPDIYDPLKVSLDSQQSSDISIAYSNPKLTLISSIILKACFGFLFDGGNILLF